ncbi:aspartyl/asparaginyl beta-hydroxylase domain-containing protein [Mycobacterium sp. Aquia_213]|uniref:aspartyl/asparaginyl beta-hydroxylase domain-containing protein n=1 Tax=Mycobacterium sp. Aquia_213 TaxID=2991728 RepID=UPI00226E9C56|nr:aspartyl/asparaginyl beta-hydroxylase domain-containing protein [Mycobacterium sp. Aquia_213]WAC90057.1 aspartyl/asparaginyl beta-hydroxylase domain-containing protein [Mycobacterium sp. Aquia_213]
MATTNAITANADRTPKALQIVKFVVLFCLARLVKVTDWCVPKRFSKVETTPFIDPSQFPWHERIVAEWVTVQSELKAILSDAETIPSHQDIIETAKPITNDDKWLSHFFYIYGQRFEKQCEQCPETTRLLQDIPGMKTAFFSILSPGKRIPPHRGPYRGVMRYHLPLLVPRSGECGIRVGDQTAKFEEGVSLMFDDTYEHEVWNDTSETRVVLFLDITRPMKFPFNIVNSAIIALIGCSPMVRKMRKKQLAFDRGISPSADTVRASS